MVEHTRAPQGPEPAGGRTVMWLLLGLLVLFGALYVTAWAYASDNVPRGTTVSGVRIGGHPSDEAAERLRRGLAERLERPIAASVDGAEVSVDADEAGLGVDYDASVVDAGGSRSWDPRRLWDYYTGGDRLDAVVTVDEAELSDLVARLDEEHGRAPVDGKVGFRGTRVVTTDPVAGRELDADAAAAALGEAWISEDATTAELETVEVRPEIDDADVSAARRDVANPAVASGVTLLFDGQEVRLEPSAYVDALSLEPRAGALARLLRARIGRGSEAEDATVRLVDGQPKVVRAQPGVTYDVARVAEGFLDVVDNPSGKRELTVKAEVARPDVTTADARGWKIRERVSTFTTYYPHADYRNVNLGRAAELIDGTVLEPGETFSLNDTVGERTRANGFTDGYVISDGILVGDLGGGVSQIATTTYNAMYFAGLEDVEHKAHSFYIDRYPVGREATVAWGSVDLRFRNTTPYGILISASVTPSTYASSGEVTVSMYSTKHWDVSTRAGGRYNITAPDTREVATQECHANEGYGGFDIDVWRYWRRPGSDRVVRSEKVTTTYTPSDTVVCTHPDPIDSVG